MKCRMLGFICLLALVISCTSTPQQQIVLVTATTWIVAATPTKTPAAAPTLTVAPTTTLPPTVALTTTLPPTVNPTVAPASPEPTKAPTVVKKWTSPANLNADERADWDPDWSHIKNNGGAIGQMINDPNFGPSIKYSVLQFRQEFDDFRYYGSKNFPRLDAKNGPYDWSYSVEVTFGPDYLPTDAGSSVSVSGAFWKDMGIGDAVNQTIVGLDIFEAHKLVLSVTDPDLSTEDGPLVRWAKYKSDEKHVIHPNIPYTIKLYTIGSNIYVSVNGEVWASGPLHPKFIGVSPVMVHAGAYGHGIQPKPGAWVINGATEVQVTRHTD